MRLNREATDERFFASFGRAAAKVKREGVVGEIGECELSGRAEGVEAEAEDEVELGRWWWTEIVRGVGEEGEGGMLVEVDEDVCGEGRCQR